MVNKGRKAMEEYLNDISRIRKDVALDEEKIEHCTNSMA